MTHTQTYFEGSARHIGGIVLCQLGFPGTTPHDAVFSGSGALCPRMPLDSIAVAGTGLVGGGSPGGILDGHINRAIEDHCLALLDAQRAVVHLAQLEFGADVHATFHVVAADGCKHKITFCISLSVQTFFILGVFSCLAWRGLLKLAASTI